MQQKRVFLVASWLSTVLATRVCQAAAGDGDGVGDSYEFGLCLLVAVASSCGLGVAGGCTELAAHATHAVRSVVGVVLSFDMHARGMRGR